MELNKVTVRDLIEVFDFERVCGDNESLFILTVLGNVISNKNGVLSVNP